MRVGGNNNRAVAVVLLVVVKKYRDFWNYFVSSVNFVDPGRGSLFGAWTGTGTFYV